MNVREKPSNVENPVLSNLFPHGWRTKNHVMLYLYDFYG